MYRFFRTAIYRFLLMTIALRYAATPNLKTTGDLRVLVRTWLNANPNALSIGMSDWVRNSVEDFEGDELLDDIITELVGMLYKPKQVSGDKDLIDVVVESLRLPLGSNRLHPTYTQALEKAIMTPN